MRKQRDGTCMAPARFGRCSAGADIHHIIPKGIGGSDEPKNLIKLCRRHHIMAEERIITIEDLQRVLTIYFGYTY